MTVSEEGAGNCTGYEVAEGGVKLMTKAERTGDRVNTGIAFVRFRESEEAQRAATQLHRKMMGSRYIECIYPIQASFAGDPCPVAHPALFSWCFSSFPRFDSEITQVCLELSRALRVIDLAAKCHRSAPHLSCCTFLMSDGCRLMRQAAMFLHVM